MAYNVNAGFGNLDFSDGKTWEERTEQMSQIREDMRTGRASAKTTILSQGLTKVERASGEVEFYQADRNGVQHPITEKEFTLINSKEMARVAEEKALVIHKAKVKASEAEKDSVSAGSAAAGSVKVERAATIVTSRVGEVTNAPPGMEQMIQAHQARLHSVLYAAFMSEVSHLIVEIQKEPLGDDKYIIHFKDELILLSETVKKPIVQSVRFELMQNLEKTVKDLKEYVKEFFNINL